MRNRTWQSAYLIGIVIAVFMGSSFLAVSTPIAKLSLYRLLALGGLAIVAFQLKQQHIALKWSPQHHASWFVATCWIWWLWAVVSGAWAMDFKLWFQAIFLLTLGVSSVTLFYLWTQSWRTWQSIIRTMWAAMTALLLLGYSEILTGKYLFADLSKVDKWQNFHVASNRVPVTIFANQNDFGVLLVTYIVIGNLLHYMVQSFFAKMSILLTQLLAMYLIYRTDSRMSLLCVVLFIAIRLAQHIRWHVTKSTVQQMVSALIAGIGVVLIVKPTIVTKIQTLLFVNIHRYVPGDVVRINLIRNGLQFLARTFGFGVGAGNIEHWMRQEIMFPTRTITNMHNWWFEILVAYGVIVFILYVVSYIMLCYKLFQLSYSSQRTVRHLSQIWLAYLIIYVLASMTSANNMLIEWHWVLFGVIVAFVYLQEKNKGVIV